MISLWRFSNRFLIFRHQYSLSAQRISTVKIRFALEPNNAILTNINCIIQRVKIKDKEMQTIKLFNLVYTNCK